MPEYDELTHRSKHETRELDEGPHDWISEPIRLHPWSRFDGWGVVLGFLLVGILGICAIVDVAWMLYLIFK